MMDENERQRLEDELRVKGINAPGVKFSDAAASPLGRCATCRWAEPLSPYGYDEDDADAVARHARYPLTCKRAEMNDGRPEDPQTLAFTMDGSSYRASLLVAPEFGCVMHESKGLADRETPPTLHGDGVTDDSEAVRWYFRRRLPLPPLPDGRAYRVIPFEVPGAVKDAANTPHFSIMDQDEIPALDLGVLHESAELPCPLGCGTTLLTNNALREERIANGVRWVGVPCQRCGTSYTVEMVDEVRIPDV